MGALAWSLFAIDLLAALGWLAFGAVASRFRSSFGASRGHLGLVVVPTFVFLLLSGAACWPALPSLRWMAGSLAVLLAVAALPLTTKAPYLAFAALLHAALWAWLCVPQAAG